MKAVRLHKKANLSIILALVIFAISGCRTVKYVEVEKVRDAYHNSTDTIRDSIYHDVFVNQYTKGDTIYRDRIEYRYHDRWHSKTDTLHRTDTISIPYPVEKKLTIWQQIKQDYFGAIIAFLLALIALGLAVGYCIYKKRTTQK